MVQRLVPPNGSARVEKSEKVRASFVVPKPILSRISVVFAPPQSTKRAQSLFLTPCSASPSWGEKHGCPSSLPPLPRSLSLLDAARLAARENARGGSDRAAHGASACRIARGRRRSMQLLFWGKSEIPWRKEGLFSEAAMDRIATRKEAVAGVAPRAHGLGGLAGRRLSSVRY